MKTAFSLFIAILFCINAKGQIIPYPVTGIGIEPEMTILGRWMEPVQIPDGNLKAGEYVRLELPAKLSNAEKKKYGKSAYPTFRMLYEGSFKNNTFNGSGKLQFKNDNTGYANWTYNGEFINGKADGYGELECSFDISNVKMKNECWFRGEFKNGQPQSGVLILNYHQEKKKTPTVFYSGQVQLNNGYITLHGFGALLRAEYDHSNFKYTQNLGVKGALYIGQFLQGSATGFALTNMVDSTGKTGPLEMVLAGADDIFTQYDNSFLYADFLADAPYAAPATKNKKLYNLFSGIDSTIVGEIVLDKDTRYKGMLKNNLPYGLGYIEYAAETGAYRDIGFWQDGQKIAVEKILKNLLPDSSWLTPKSFSAMAKNCTNVYNDKIKKLERICVDQQLSLQYYGAVSSKGYPTGWGLMAGPDKIKYIGKFNGANPSADASGLMNAEQLFNYTNNQQWEYNYYNAAQAANDQFYNRMEAGVFDPLIPGIQPPGFKRIFKRTAFAEDMFISKRWADYIKFEKEFVQQLAARPSISVQTVYIKRSDMGKSYIVDKLGNKIYGVYINKEQLGRGDYVFLQSAIYHVHDSYRNIMLGREASDGFWWAEQIPKQVFVIRGYNITDLPHRLVYCSGCSDLPPAISGPVTYTGSAHSGRYETNVYQNNSGGGSVVSKAIYTQISITLPPPVRKPCKVCKDKRKYEKTPLNIIEL